MEASMDIDIGQEIINHLEWIENIADLLGKEAITAEELEVITRHDNCELGHWLESEGTQGFKDFPEFKKLTASHEVFHKLAGSLITALHQGKEAEAIAAQEEFVETSQEVIGYLQALQQHVSEEH
jgi:hypothetical protein